MNWLEGGMVTAWIGSLVLLIVFAVCQLFGPDSAQEQQRKRQLVIAADLYRVEMHRRRLAQKEPPR